MEDKNEVTRKKFDIKLVNWIVQEQIKQIQQEQIVQELILQEGQEGQEGQEVDVKPSGDQE